MPHRLTILQGDALEMLRALPAESVHCCVTSPPYWGLRDYGVAGQMGLEKTPEEYVEKMTHLFREVRRVMRGDGTLWVNMGDSYASQPAGNFGPDMPAPADGGRYRENKPKINLALAGLKPKDLVGIPWRLAFALQADGWWLRQDIIWAKPNPMPESVTDRCTKAHEYVFLLSKSARYFFDAEAVKEPAVAGFNGSSFTSEYDLATKTGLGKGERVDNGNRNRRSVWAIPSEAFPGSHFATYPTALVKPCILAGTSARGCCPKCGGPWERVVEQVPPPKCQRNPPRPRMAGNDQMAASLRANGDNWNGPELAAWRAKNPPKESWRPTCECAGQDDRPGLIFEQQHPEFIPIPCTVLDPFAGSGTTGQVALELGRQAVLIELNPEYVQLIRRRCDVTPGLNLA